MSKHENLIRNLRAEATHLSAEAATIITTMDMVIAELKRSSREERGKTATVTKERDEAMRRVSELTARLEATEKDAIKYRHDAAEAKVQRDEMTGRVESLHMLLEAVESNASAADSVWRKRASGQDAWHRARVAELKGDVTDFKVKVRDTVIMAAAEYGMDVDGVSDLLVRLGLPGVEYNADFVVRYAGEIVTEGMVSAVHGQHENAVLRWLEDQPLKKAVQVELPPGGKLADSQDVRPAETHVGVTVAYTDLDATAFTVEIS